MLNRPLPAPARDISILIGRVILGVVLFAHGWQKLVINGISGTYGQFEKLGIPLAIVSASFASFVEFVGGVLIILGALTTTVVALDLVVMLGAAGFVHLTHGLFAQDGGWELVGVIVAAELALAAFGPGRFSVDHVMTRRRERERDDLRQSAKPAQRPTTWDGAFTPTVEASAGPLYPTGGFAAVDHVGWPAATRRDRLPGVGAAASEAAPTGAFAVAAPSAAQTGAFPVPASEVTPTEAFPVAASEGAPTGAFAVTPPRPKSVGAYVANAAAGASIFDTSAPAAPAPTSASASTGAFPAAASVSAPTGAFTAVAPSAETETPVSASAAAGRSGAGSSPRMASAGVHRVMSERAGRPASEVPAPFGVTVQSPLDFTPTAALPVVPPSPATEMIAIATGPGALPRRVPHAPDLPRASAVRPYA